jgi:predicted alpha/beta-hydrolase family hydrolase
VAAETLQEITIQADDAVLPGELGMPSMEPRGIVLFAHGSGSSRLSTRNQYVAAVLRDAGFWTILFDLLTESEEQTDVRTGEHRFNVDFLARRLDAVAGWVEPQDWSGSMAFGYFGASTGAAAAIIAAAEGPHAWPRSSQGVVGLTSRGPPFRSFGARPCSSLAATTSPCWA